LLSGVVQGSGIGPVLLLTYIDDLAQLLQATVFGDDVKTYFEISTDDDNITNSTRLNNRLG